MKHSRSCQQTIDMFALQNRWAAPHNQSLENPVSKDEPTVLEQRSPRRWCVAVPPYVTVEPGDAASYYTRFHIFVSIWC